MPIPEANAQTASAASAAVMARARVAVTPVMLAAWPSFPRGGRVGHCAGVRERAGTASECIGGSGSGERSPLFACLCCSP